MEAEASFLRFLLVLYSVSAFIVAVAYLRYRRAVLLDYLLWGTVAVTVPVLGPFLVIAARPGPRKHTRKFSTKKRG